jgi:hypothetical protein
VRLTIREELGTPDNCSSVSLDSWNGVHPHRNIRTYRTVGKMYKVEWGLCIKKQLLVDNMMYLGFA